jgi:hypothetical protein
MTNGCSILDITLRVMFGGLPEKCKVSVLLNISDYKGWVTEGDQTAVVTILMNFVKPLFIS